jgi:hypothetical protein
VFVLARARMVDKSEKLRDLGPKWAVTPQKKRSLVYCLFSKIFIPVCIKIFILSPRTSSGTRTSALKTVV